MSKTAQQIGLDLLSYINIKSFQPISGLNALNRPVITPDDVSKVLTAINGALEVCFTDAPAEFKKQDRSALFHEITTVTVAITTMTNAGVGTLPAWMLGCTCTFPGDPVQNRIVGISGTAIAFLYAYTGTSGSLPLTVYSDAALLAADVKTVGEPVQIPQPSRRLVNAGEKQRFDRYSYQEESRYAPFTIINKAAGLPIYYYVDTFYNPDAERVPIFLRLNPMPFAAVQVNYQAELHPQLITAADLYNSGDWTADPGRKFTSIPAVWVDSCFLPICRKMFAAHPSFKNQEAKKEIDQQYAKAIAFLAGQKGTIVSAAKRVRYI